MQNNCYSHNCEQIKMSLYRVYTTKIVVKPHNSWPLNSVLPRRFLPGAAIFFAWHGARLPTTGAMCPKNIIPVRKYPENVLLHAKMPVFLKKHCALLHC